MMITMLFLVNVQHQWQCRQRKPSNFFQDLTMKNKYFGGTGKLNHAYNHGLYGTPIYRKWISMKARCLNPNAKGYDRYGGKGVTVCDEWMEFTNFYRDMGDIPSPRLTLDRIDNSKGYSKSNCKWSTIKEQNNNKSNVRKIKYRNQLKTISEWAEIFKVKRKYLYTLLYRNEFNPNIFNAYFPDEVAK